MDQCVFCPQCVQRMVPGDTKVQARRPDSSAVPSEVLHVTGAAPVSYLEVPLLCT